MIVRVDLRSLLCINNSDEVGIAEDDEVRVLHRGYLTNQEPSRWTKWRRENIGDGEWAITAKKPLTLWKGELPSDATLMVQCVFSEEGGRGLVGDVIQLAVGELFGQVPGLQDLVKDMTKRKDDYIGAVELRLKNVGGQLQKNLNCGRHCKVAGYKGYGHLSETRRTVRVRMRHWLPGDNLVDYQASFNVWDTGQSPTDPVVWTASDGATNAA